MLDKPSYANKKSPAMLQDFFYTLCTRLGARGAFGGTGGGGGTGGACGNFPYFASACRMPLSSST
jgi:hypothetical protein